MTNNELTLSQLRDVSGGGAPKNDYAKRQKPKFKKIKPAKPFTINDVMNSGGSPGPFLPGPDYINQYVGTGYQYHVLGM